MTEDKIYCYSCNKSLELEPEQTIQRSEECPHCYASIRSCRMCKFYDKTVYNECKETSADRIVDKEKANFCDFFVLKGDKNDNDDKNSALAAANALFKD